MSGDFKMTSLNTVTLIGHLGSKPETRKSKQGASLQPLALQPMTAGRTKTEINIKKPNGTRVLSFMNRVQSSLKSTWIKVTLFLLF